MIFGMNNPLFHLYICMSNIFGILLSFKKKEEKLIVFFLKNLSPQNMVSKQFFFIEYSLIGIVKPKFTRKK